MDLYILKVILVTEIHILFNQVGTVRFPAHQFIVASRCEVLAKRMVEQSGNFDVNEIELKGMRPDVFRQVLQFIYTNDCSLLHAGECPIK